MPKKRQLKLGIWLFIIVVVFICFLLWVYYPDHAPNKQELSLGEVVTIDNQSTPATHTTKSQAMFSIQGNNYQKGYGGVSQIYGRVFSQSDDPIEGATIILSVQGQEFDQVISDNNGFYSVEVAIEVYAGLRIEKPGFWPVTDAHQFEHGKTLRKDFFLPEAESSLQGVVKDISGIGISKVYVYAGFKKEIKSSGISSLAKGTAQTDHNGWFVLDGIPSGTAIVIAEAHGYIPVKGREVVELEPGETTSVSFIFQKGRTISVRVTDENGQQIPYSHVSTFISGRLITKKTDSKGEIQLTVPRHLESLDITVGANGFLGREISLDLVKSSHSVILEPGPVLHGVVLSQGGNPVPEANVFIRATYKQGTRLIAMLKTDDFGVFSTHVPDTNISRIIVTARGYIKRTAEITSTSDFEDLEIRLRRAEGGIYGRVFNTNGNPLNMFYITLTSIDPQTADFRLYEGFYNPEGTFAFMDLLAGQYNLEVWEPKTGARKQLNQIRVNEGTFTGEISVQF